MRIIEVFTSIQGEGVHTGVPMHFVRFAGCNLRCVGCDTPRAHDGDAGKSMESIEVIELINKHEHPKVKWVCFTGGEPVLQQDEWSELTRMLQEREYKLSMETNGTLWMSSYLLQRFDWICVSPKTDDVRELPLIPHAHEIKFLLRHTQTFSTFNEFGRILRVTRSLNQSAVISIQPWLVDIDERDHSTLSLAFGFVKHFGVRLSLQTHKMIGVP